MAIEAKEIILNVRKVVMLLVRISYRSVRAHPIISGMLVFFFLLYRAFPLMFAFLIPYSPVIVCTAVLLGTLLSYGSPNIPGFEEEDKKSQEISSLQTRNVVGDLVVKKDESYAVETHVPTPVDVTERAVEDVTGEAHNRSNGEIEDNSHVAADLLRAENKRTQTIMKAIEETEPVDLGDSWEPVYNHEAAPGSDSDSDGDESSSPDASMADIIPMLDELHPLLDTEHPQPKLRGTESTDDASGDSSEDHESDDGNSEEETGNKEATQTQQQEKAGTDEATAVPWTEDDQKNVMDLGYSEEERNRRLENLIARRRLRKLQRYETEKNLIDLDSFYPTSIPSISAPRQNPFETPYELDGNMNLHPIPGSAPSVLQPRQNPFDLPYDQEQQLTNLSHEYLRHYDFVTAAQREMLAQRDESSSVGQRMGSEGTGYTAFERQLSRLAGVSTATFVEDHKEPSEIDEDRIIFSPISPGFENVEEEKPSIETPSSTDNKQEEISVEAETDRAIDFTTENSEDEIRREEDNMQISSAEKVEVIEARCDDLDSSSEEENAQVSGINIHEESSDLKQSAEEPTQLEWVGSAQYDSSPTEIVGSLSNTSTADEAFHNEDSSQAASPPRPFEANLPVKDQDHAVDRSEGEDLKYGIGAISVEHSIADESESRGLSEIKEQETREVGNLETSDEVHHLEPVIPKSEADKSIHSSSSSSESSEWSEDESVGEDNKHIQAEGSELFNEANMQDSHASISEAPPNEENLEDANVEGDEIAVSSPEKSDITASLVEESNARAFELEQEPSTHQEDAEGNIDGDLVTGVPSDKNNGGVSGDAPTILTDSDVSPRSPVLEQTETGEVSTILEANSEMNVQGTVADENLSTPDEGFVNNLDSIDGELAPEEHAEVSGIKDIDEGLLSELDAVGDFHVVRELKLDQGGPRHELGQFDVQDSGEATGADTLPAVSFESDKSDPVIEQPKSAETEVGSSLLSSGEDPEMTVYNSKLHVLEACSIEELDSVFKKQHEEAVVTPPASDIAIDNTESSEPETGASGSQELLVLEAKSVEDISSSVKKISEGDEPTVTEAETSEVLAEVTLLEAEETKSDLHEVETRSLEDIDLALKQLSDVKNVESSTEKMTHEIGHTEDEAGKQELEQEAIGGQSPKLAEAAASQTDTSEIVTDTTHLVTEETQSDLHEIEARSLEEIGLALKQLSDDHVVNSLEMMKHETDHTEDEASTKDLEAVALGEQILESPEDMRVQPSEETKLDPVGAVGSQAETSEALTDTTHLETEEIKSDLHEVETRSLEDIELALKQLSDVNVDHAEDEEGKRGLEPEAVSDQFPESTTDMKTQPAEETKLDPVVASG